ncbi:hypothetical protein [Asanoa siamensis]|uniref:Uncharacterized protein n=1 Tax=Asanoa siamensis TaxID=926357 RepID=A0ABQ4CR41_9ACTN|nr:hypothetical protein [Asanoa siamensis]GIF73757.1 hypothetical protein Asi02nite_32750 [Asanoa siamensis]
MALSNEDLPPTWLRDYAAIEADIQRLEDFATQLDAEVRDNFAPHVAPIFDDILTELPGAYSDFPELLGFLQSHAASAQDTAYTVYYYQDVTGGFAVAAGEVSRNYRDADAFSAARVADVKTALGKTAAGSTDA